MFRFVRSPPSGTLPLAVRQGIRCYALPGAPVGRSKPLLLLPQYIHASRGQGRSRFAVRYRAVLTVPNEPRALKNERQSQPVLYRNQLTNSCARNRRSLPGGPS